MGSIFSIREAVEFIKLKLKSIYPDEEINAFIFIIFEHLLGFSRLDVHTNLSEKLPDNKTKQLKSIVKKLKNHEPIQYVLGNTEFYSLRFFITRDVLIPRPETEELVQWIINQNQQRQLQILDIGTGSGCIAIALAKNLPNASVSAIDISKPALAIAKKNAKKNNSIIQFYHADILKWSDYPKIIDYYDVIVSNPPYIRESEKKLMSKNVLDHEPNIALFVTDSEPLIYYKAIADFAAHCLKIDGRLFFEINENFGAQTKMMLEHKGFADVEIKKDINGRDRMIRCKKNKQNF